jgi:hypothetical protein
MTEISHFGQDMKELLQEKVYVINVLGWISSELFHSFGTSIICIKLVIVLRPLICCFKHKLSCALLLVHNTLNLNLFLINLLEIQIFLVGNTSILNVEIVSYQCTKYLEV